MKKVLKFYCPINKFTKIDNMKIKILISVVAISLVTTVNGVVFAQTPNRTTAPATNTQDPDKINNIKKLLEITGTKTLSRQIINQMLVALKGEYPQVPQKFWDTFVAELKPEDMTNEFIPIYSKYFTNDEIKQIIAFYQTPIGQKTLTVLPQLSRESAAIGIRYGKEAAARAIKKLEAEGYIHRRQ
ncbi:MAG: DUF2059 domain-containing protein [Aulosira sp. ZfuVER01]|nr:DUF2059 domain-containing protein [Aulosira sp. ZfuVER01]MDZ8002134.1 DUF2059 domain-containing protein [Aulosira sp. DedVER01a]MDZ8052599.1 DUF2059 domain-containing protein [Aulosira sp. ZfuCHP01]